jgi:hypothetical protein
MKGAVKVSENRLKCYSSGVQLGILDTRILLHLLIFCGAVDFMGRKEFLEMS